MSGEVDELVIEVIPLSTDSIKYGLLFLEIYLKQRT